MFANLKNSRMFAVPNFVYSSVVSVFLCTANSVSANDIGYQIPFLGNTATSYVMEFGDSGGDSLSCIHSVTNKFHSKMPNSNEICNTIANNGIATPPNGAKSVVSSLAQNIQGNSHCIIYQFLFPLKGEELQGFFQNLNKISENKITDNEIVTSSSTFKI